VNDKYDQRCNNYEHRKQRQKNKHGNKEALCCCPVDRTDWYLSCYSVQMKTVKWPKKVVVYLLNCTLFNAFFVYRTVNTNKKVKYKNFLHGLGRCWISEDQNTTKSSSDDLQVSEKQSTPRGPKQDLPGRLSGDFRIQILVAGGEGKKTYPARECKVCAAHKKQNETRYISKFCIVPLHKGSCFEKYHPVKTYYTIYMQFLQSQAQGHNL